MKYVALVDKPKRSALDSIFLVGVFDTIEDAYNACVADCRKQSDGDPTMEIAPLSVWNNHAENRYVCSLYHGEWSWFIITK